MTRFMLLLAVLLFAAVSALAEPARYRLDAAESSVQFTYALSGTPATGTMPITRADLTLDFQQVARSKASVTLNADGTKTGVILITQALKGSDVLDTARYPGITFTSRNVTGTANGARLTGDVTIRGVTRPLVLDAKIYRRDGSAAGDLSRLTVLLTGAIDRRDFGADGYPALVDPTVRLRILARLDRVDG